MVKNPLANAANIRDASSIPGAGRSPGKGNDYPLQYSCLENPLDIGAWQATDHRQRVRHDRGNLACSMCGFINLFLSDFCL